MAKATAPESDAPVFDVSQTDKRNDKRVVLDYVFASRYNPELLEVLAPYADEVERVLAVEGLQEISTPIDTQIAALSDALVARYEGAYSDYEMRGNGESFWLPKSGRTVKSVAEKAEDIIAKASDEQLEALAALMKARGIEL